MATAIITEFTDVGSRSIPAPIEPALTSQSVSFTATAGVTATAFGASTVLIRIYSDTAGYFLIETNPTATTSSQPIAANTEYFRCVKAGSSMKISLVTA